MRFISNHIAAGWATRVERLTYRSESSEPRVSFPHLGIWLWVEEPLEHMALKASKDCVQELHRDWGKQIPLLKGLHRFSWVQGTREGQRLQKNLGQIYLWILEDLLGK